MDVLPALTGWVRGTLVGMVLGLVVVFAIALWLNPYDEDGTPRQMETHTKLGLPPWGGFGVALADVLEQRRDPVATWPRTMVKEVSPGVC